MAAEALFDEGKKKLGQNDIAGACQAFEKGQKLDPGLGNLLYLADCTEKLGRTASAWAMYREAISIAKSAGQADLEALATRRAQALGPRLPKVKLRVLGGEVPGFALTRDHEPIPPIMWGTELPVDPGTHEYEATAPSKKAWKMSVTVKEGEPARELEIPALADDPTARAASSAPAPTTSAPASAPPPPVPPPPPVSPPPPAWRTPVLVGLGGLALGGIVVGSIFGLKASSQNKDASNHCPNSPTKCDATGVSLGDDAHRSATISTISFAVGGAALVGGLVTLLLPSTPAPEVSRVRWRPGPGPGQVGLSLDGAW
jgi:hypothetical protein